MARLSRLLKRVLSWLRGVLGARRGIVLSGREVFVLGAGFSAAVSHGVMPITSKLSEEVRDHARLAESKFGDIEARVGKRGFEGVLDSLTVHAPWRTKSERLHFQALFADVVEVVDECIGNAEAEARAEPLDPHLRALIVHWRAHRSTVVTFNYDVLIEAAYSEVIATVPADERNPLAYSDLYPIGVEPAPGRAVSLLGAERAKDAFTLLKLHGSRSLATPASSTTRTDTTYAQTMIRGWEIQPNDTYPDYFTGDLETMIMPPTSLKSEYVGNNIIDHMWKRAHVALSSTDHIIVIGYSLPEADILVRLMLQDSIHEREPRITVVDPDLDKRIRTHYENSLGRTVSGFKSLNEFMRAASLA